MPSETMTWLWIGWIGLFVIAEAYTLLTGRPQDTLSANIWRWFSIFERSDDPKRKNVLRTRRVLLLALMVFGIFHFFGIL